MKRFEHLKNAVSMGVIWDHSNIYLTIVSNEGNMHFKLQTIICISEIIGFSRINDNSKQTNA